MLRNRKRPLDVRSAIFTILKIVTLIQTGKKRNFFSLNLNAHCNMYTNV